MFDEHVFTERLLELIYIKTFPAALERATGIKAPTMTNWKKGRYLPTVTTAMRILKAIDATADEVLWLYQYE